MSNAPLPPRMQATDLPPAASKPAVSQGPPAAAKPPAAKRVSSGDQSDSRAMLRRSVYGILVALSAGAMIGRVLAVNSADQIATDKRIIAETVAAKKQELTSASQWKGQSDKELEELTRPVWQPLLKERPFLSANDRSRWLTVRALVEKGTYAIEDYVTDPKTHPNWDTIDAVMHEDSAKAAHMYSSKPPILATLLAAPYWVICKVASAIKGAPVNLGTNPYEIGRGMTLLVNVVPMLVYFFMLASLIEKYGKSDWGRILVMAAAAFGTFLTTFAVALNNHLPAAVCAAITLWAVCRIWYDGQRGAGTFAIAGLFAACTAAFELPALSFFAIISIGLLVKSPRRTLLIFSPAALVVVAAFFATNWLAHGSLIPPYAHRDYTGFSAGDQSDRFEDTVKVDSGDTVTLRGHKSNWYDYEFTRTDGKLVSSYWRPENRHGIDAGESSVGKYAVNLLVGHHGVFSLTPIWLLAIPGVLLLWWNDDYGSRDLAILILLVSVVCVAFYISRPLADRNYGGMTSGFRWVFWMAPLWLLAILPTADWLARRRLGRLAGCVFLALSVVSASYPVWNPWTHPWLQNLWIYMGL
jgi:hypothetical protein